MGFSLDHRGIAGTVQKDFLEPRKLSTANKQVVGHCTPPPKQLQEVQCQAESLRGILENETKNHTVGEKGGEFKIGRHIQSNRYTKHNQET